MNMHDFLRKYGTRAVSMLLRELAVRKKNAEVAMEAANDLQAMLEHMITHNELMAMSVREVMATGTEHGKTGD